MQNQLKKALAFLLLFSINSIMAQDSLKVKTKTNPIIFYEIYFGVGGAEYAGWNFALTANYQFFKNDLLTVRAAGFTSYGSEIAMIAPVIGLPVFRKNEQIGDFGILYGKRWIAGGFSFSASAGISHINYEHLEYVGEGYHIRKENLIGLPFEINVKFFKREKQRLRLHYGLIPVTRKKVAFGRSFGFKLSGNVSKANYIAFGISCGLGTHKKY